MRNTETQDSHFLSFTYGTFNEETPNDLSCSYTVLLHTHTAVPETDRAGLRCNSLLFEGPLVVGRNATNYDSEVLAACEATTQLLSADLASAKVVFFIESQAAILALSSNAPTECLNTTQCRTKIAKLISFSSSAALQWIESHVGIPGNERANQKANQEAESTQPQVLLILRRAKSIIILGATGDPIPRHMERAETAARFRVTTGHVFLRVYLHWLGVAANEACPIYGPA
ncbi:reverse transcriptase [Trichonephila clavipes]|nr:reverse transcriptase [Trichonephila clavipes]